MLSGAVTLMGAALLVILISTVLLMPLETASGTANAVQAADIADLSLYVAKNTTAIPETITQMAEDTVRMVTESVDAFVKSDLELCRNVIDRDDVVDDAFNEIKEKLADMIYGGNLDAKTGLDLLMTAKYFERIGDHAVNIAEWVEYSITGQHRNNEHQDFLNN